MIRLDKCQGLVTMSHGGGPYESEMGTLCSDRGQSRDAFQEILLEETSSRGNNIASLNEATQSMHLFVLLVFSSL